MNNNDIITAKIGTRTFTFAPKEVSAVIAADMDTRGWEPRWFIGTGVRGATFLAYRCKFSGQFVRITKL